MMGVVIFQSVYTSCYCKVTICMQCLAFLSFLWVVLDTTFKLISYPYTPRPVLPGCCCIGYPVLDDVYHTVGQWVQVSEYPSSTRGRMRLQIQKCTHVLLLLNWKNNDTFVDSTIILHRIEYMSGILGYRLEENYTKESCSNCPTTYYVLNKKPREESLD